MEDLDQNLILNTQDGLTLVHELLNHKLHVEIAFGGNFPFLGSSRSQGLFFLFRNFGVVECCTILSERCKNGVME